jgi:hypothetical protein
MLEKESDARGDEHAAAAEGRAEAHAPDGLDAIAIELHRGEMWLGGRAKADRGDEVILQPATQAVESEVVPLLHADTQVAKDAQGGLGVCAMPQVPTQIQEEVRFLSRNGIPIAQQFIDHLQRATLGAMRWPAFGDGIGADLGSHGSFIKV